MKVLIEDVAVFVDGNKTDVRQVEIDSSVDTLSGGPCMGSIKVVGENIFFLPDLMEYGKIKRSWIDKGGKWL